MSNIEDAIHDLFGFEAPSEQILTNISSWASKALELQSQIEQVEEMLKGLNSELREIEEKLLPDALLTAGMVEFKLKNGGKITIKDVIQGGLSKDPPIRDFIMDWVEKEGGREIIKNHFEIDYTKGQYNQAVAFRHVLQDLKIQFDEFESIHVQTLHSFLREKIEKGEDVPFEKMALRYFKKATVKLPKEKDNE